MLSRLCSLMIVLSLFCTISATGYAQPPRGGDRDLDRQLLQELEQVARMLRENREVEGRRPENHERHPEHSPERPHHSPPPQQEKMEKIQHLRQAAGHLEQAGMGEVAKDLRRKAEEIERSIPKPEEHPRQAGQHLGEIEQLTRHLREMTQEFRRLSDEVEGIKKRLPQPDGVHYRTPQPMLRPPSNNPPASNIPNAGEEARDHVRPRAESPQALPSY